MNRLAGKVAVITGAGSGIGRASASLFAAEGASLVLTDVDAASLGSAAESLNAEGRAVVAIQGDIGKEQTALLVTDAARSTFAAIDVLLNCAGIDLVAPITGISAEQWDRVMEVNLKSVFLMVKHAVPLLSRTGASIINVSSAAGISPIPGRPAYIASKGGMIALTRSLALDLAPAIRVNCICPGAVETPLLHWGLKDAPDYDAALRQVIARYPLRRIAEPGEIANAALFLASDESSYMTGTTLAVDGGRSMA